MSPSAFEANKRIFVLSAAAAAAAAIITTMRIMNSCLH